MAKVKDYFYSGEEMQQKSYYINYGTGAGNEYVDGTIADAMRVADSNASYTECDIEIYTASAWKDLGSDALVVAVRHWRDVPFDPNDEANRNITDSDIIPIGSGYYDAWSVREDENDDITNACVCDWVIYTDEMY